MTRQSAKVSVPDHATQAQILAFGSRLQWLLSRLPGLESARVRLSWADRTVEVVADFAGDLERELENASKQIQNSS